MRCSLLTGMLAGSLIGAAATLVALPYVQPSLNKAVKKSKRVINHALNKMHY